MDRLRRENNHPGMVTRRKETEMKTFAKLTTVTGIERRSVRSSEEQGASLFQHCDCDCDWDEIQTVMHSNPVLFAGGRHHPHQFYSMHDPKSAGISYNNIVYYDNPVVTGYMEKAMHASSMEEANK